MQKGYPPAIIKTEDKENYYGALQQADAGQIEYFFNYICVQINNSLELMLKGAKGEEIEDPDDLDKKLALLKQKIDADDEDNDIKMTLSTSVIKQLLTEWGYELLEKIAKQAVKFNEFYLDNEHYVSISLEKNRPHFSFKEKLQIDKIKTSISEVEDRIINSAELLLSLNYGAYRKGGIEPFGCNYYFKILFTKHFYEIEVPTGINNNTQNKIPSEKRLLHKPLLPGEIDDIVNNIGGVLLNHLETEIAKMSKNNKQI